MSNQEARFLEARQARTNAATAQRLKRTSWDEPSQTAKDFWTSLRRDFCNWESRLCNLQQQQESNTDIQETTMELDVLLQDLYTLKTKSLSCNDVMELPAADVRLLHDEFTARATQLQQVRARLIPISKFKFSRYRAALQQRKEEKEEDEVLRNDDTVEKPVAPLILSTPTARAGNGIENYTHATLIMNSNGTLVVHDEHTDKEHAIPRDDANAEHAGSSLLIQNVHHCHVTIHGTYKALHIQNVSSSTIQIVHAIEGALHMTACHNVKLQACSHQLRIHASSSLQLHVQVNSGPILEECHDVTFYATCKEDIVHDTKDFGWLRNGIASPNFCIVIQQQEEANSESDGDARLIEEEESPDEQVATALDNDNTVSAEEDSDEEDEL